MRVRKGEAAMGDVIQVGARARRPDWDEGMFVRVTAAGDTVFLARLHGDGLECTYNKAGDWERHVEPPTVAYVCNVYDSGTGAEYEDRPKADHRQGEKRIGVLTVYTDGSAEYEDVRHD